MRQGIRLEKSKSINSLTHLWSVCLPIILKNKFFEKVTLIQKSNKINLDDKI